MRCPFKDIGKRMRNLDFKKGFGLTQKGSHVRGKSANGLPGINLKKVQIRNEKGNDQPPIFQI